MELCYRTRLELASDHPLTYDRLLRRLEVARQELSVRWCGQPGGFAGYDVLEMPAPLPSTGSVVFTARIVETFDGSHVVELTAVHEHTGLVLLKGHGRTLEGATGLGDRDRRLPMSATGTLNSRAGS